MGSRESGLAVLAKLPVDSVMGGVKFRDVVSLEAVGGARAFEGLVGVARDEDVNGRLGATDAAPPSVVLRDLSALESGLGGRTLLVPKVDVRETEGRLFSSVGAPSSAAFAAGLRTEEGTGRVGGLLMVLPEVREANVLGLVGVEEVAGVRALVLSLDVFVVGFLGSSLVDPGRTGGLPPVVLRSIVMVHMWIRLPYTCGTVYSDLVCAWLCIA